jgi:hypothetical protein
MHRDYFKSFSIDTVDDLLQRAELLFKECLNAIRFVDLSSITDTTKNSKNKNRATTHPLWEHFAESYKLKDFLALQAPLERVKRKSYAYTIEEAIKEQVTLARKAYIHNIEIDEEFYKEVLEKFRNTKEYTYEDKKENVIKQQEYEIIYEDSNQTINPKELSILELEKYLKKLEVDMAFPDLDMHIIVKQYQMASVELQYRKKKSTTNSTF